MKKIEIKVTRIFVVSGRPFEEVVTRLMSTIGRPDMARFHQSVIEVSTVLDLEQLVQEAVGSSNLMEFTRYDAGEILRKGASKKGPNMLRLVIGNPIIMKEMAKLVADAAAYAPVTILVDERRDGVHVSYDLMESLLVPYNVDAALNVARDLDMKIERMLESLILI